MFKKTAVILVIILTILGFTSKVEAQLCVPASVYDNLAWTWEYWGPCDSSYNCLSYAIGVTNSWTWPWGSSLPTDSQVTSYLATKGYNTTGSVSKIISYGTTSAINHFSKVHTSTSCLAKCGQLNVLKHNSWDPYHHSGAYGAKVRVYKTGTVMSVLVTGPIKGNNSGTYTWCANVTGGTAPYTYQWKYCYDGDEYNYNWGTSQCKTAHMPLDFDLYLKVNVTDANGLQKTAYHMTMNMDSIKPPKRRSMDNLLENSIAELSFTIEGNRLSPNPYDYIDNEAFRKIVDLGPKALVSIKNHILSSRSNGLTEYILAIAAEKIAAVNLKEESILWDNPKNWTLSWDKFLTDLPSKIESIVNGKLSPEDRDAKLVNLGFAAIPLLKDRIDSGEPGLKGAFDKLVGKLQLKEAARVKSNSLEEVIETYRKLVNSKR